MMQHPKEHRGSRLAALFLLSAATLSAWAQNPSTPPSPAKIPASQGPVAPFDITGFIQFASVDSNCTGNPPQPAGCKGAGGWIEVNNHVIRVPQNTVLQMPANTLTWEEVFEFNSTGNTSESGMALADSSRLPGTFEAHIQGNIVNGIYTAGLIFLAQQSLNSSQGFIESLDLANGIMVVNGKRVQINDPAGKFSIGISPDARFSVDEDNPTIRSETAYPMCIPRPATPPATDDPLCPQKNRRDASGNVQMNFTIDAPGTLASPADPNPSDPTVFAPFEVGDYVTYSGTLLRDGSGDYISANTIIGNVGIYTTPGTNPAYVAIDVLLQGVGGVPNPAFPQEAGVRTRVEGFSTDPSRTVDIYAIDADCNGNVTQRSPAWVANFGVDPGPPTGAKKGRFRFRPNGGTFLPPSRNVGVRVTGAPQVVFNPTLNIITGQYQAPDFTFIFPENLAIGSPPVPSNFGDLPFLINGEGNWRGIANQPLGQINPFPDVNAPAVSCTGTPGGNPASAVANFSPAPGPEATGITVTLDATGSTPSSGPFVWTQTAGPTVALSNANSVQATFVAPTVNTATNLTFQVSVGGGNSTAPASATVTVPIAAAPNSNPPTVTASSAPANPVASSSTVTLSATGVDPASGTLTYTWTAPAGITLSPVAGTNGAQQTFTAPAVPALTPASSLSFAVTATSSISGLSSAPASVTVVVNPAVDTVGITNVVYRQSKARLDVTATDFTPGVTLTCTLDIINKATGKPWTGVMGPAVPAAAGTFAITFTNIPAPNLVTVTSSGGGKATSGVTRVR